jgi:streptomycin 6-kinase
MEIGSLNPGGHKSRDWSVKETMLNIDPIYCKRKILDVHGAFGAHWLEQLPVMVAECAGRWNLEVMAPFPVESYSYVVPAFRGGEAVVLKIGVPGLEFTRQIEALRHWNGSGICRLLEADAESGFLLMERVLPGESLRSISDDEQVTRVALEVMQRLWKPAPQAHNFPTVADWAADLQKLRDRFNGGFGPFPPDVIQRAERQFAELLDDGSPPMLIHGDVNWGNILRGQRQDWLLIDPKGVVGNPLYDAATFLNDPPEGLHESELKRLLSRRVAQVAEGLGFERECVKAWAQAHCILAGYWTYEDHNGQGWEAVFEMAKIYADFA